MSANTFFFPLSMMACPLLTFFLDLTSELTWNSSEKYPEERKKPHTYAQTDRHAHQKRKRERELKREKEPNNVHEILRPFFLAK